MEGTTVDTVKPVGKIKKRVQTKKAPEKKLTPSMETKVSLDNDVLTVESKPAVKKDAGEKQFYHSKGWPRLWVTVHDDQMTSGMDGAPVDNFVSLNGYAYQIQRNQKVAIPEPVVRMMESLELMKVYRNEANEMAYRPVKRFSMTIHGPAPMDV